MSRDFRAKRKLLYDRQKGRCFHCHGAVSREDATVDHLVPRALGGSDWIWNLRMSCFACNQKRAAGLSGMLNAAVKDPRIKLVTFIKTGHVSEVDLASDRARAPDDWFRREPYCPGEQKVTLEWAFERAGINRAMLIGEEE